MSAAGWSEIHLQIGASGGRSSGREDQGLSREKPQIWLAWLLKQSKCWNFPGEIVSRNTGNTVRLLYCRMFDFTIKIL